MRTAYEVRIARAALRAWNALRPREHAQVGRRLDALAENPRLPGSRKLSGGFEGYRLAAGEFRILYEVDDEAKVVAVYRIAPRATAYRRL